MGINEPAVTTADQSGATTGRPPTRSPSANSGGTGRWIAAIAVLVVLTEQSALGFQLIAPALGGLAAKYETTQVIWTITTFTLVGGVVAPLIGKLGDRYGKRRVLVYAAVVSLIGSAVSALAPNFEILLLGRALTGVSAAFLPITIALMRDVFPPRMRDISISIATNGVGVVTIAGPFIAGFFIDHVSLESVFWFVGALSLIGAIGTIALIPESPVRNHASIDFVGAIGLVVGVFALLFGISQISSWELADPRTLGVLGAGIVILALWWGWEKRISEPFIEPAILNSRKTSTVLLAYAFGGGAITVIASYLPTFLQTPRELGGSYGFGLDATGVARYLVLPGVLTVVGGLIVGILAKRYGFRFFLILGSGFVALGAVGLAIFTEHTWGPILMYAIVGFGAMIYAAGPSLLMTVAPAEQRGVSAGVMSATMSIVGSLFAQIAGLVLSRNTANVVSGMPVYSGKGVALVFFLAAAMGVVALAISLYTPRSAEPLDA